MRDGMMLGLGTGTTASFFVQEVGRRVAEGLRVQAVATSIATARQASALGIPLVDSVDSTLDLAVDGADEIDPQRSLIKGRGGALFREKVVAVNSDRFVVIADESKLVERLGRGPLPVEVLPFLWEKTVARLERLGRAAIVRTLGREPYRTDNGNLIVDLEFDSGIADPVRLATEIKSVVGVVEHGLYLGIATGCIVAGTSGTRVLGSLE